MRIHLAGSFVGLNPVTLVFFEPGSYSFDKTVYPDHTNYDVMVIGAGGGEGGGLAGPDADHDDRSVINFGGAGGGGGSHRLQGLLSNLDDTTDITVGAVGGNGDDGGDDPDAATDGEDGEFSSFGDFVMASGGKGGRKSASLSYDENQIADGGDGGVGGRTTVGGGALGGICGLNNDPEAVDPLTHTAGEPGGDGTLISTADGTIGQGGGGGGGGSIRDDPDFGHWIIQPPIPTYGGRGSYNSDEIIFSPQGPPRVYSSDDGPLAAKAGRGGGARVTPFNGSNATYGDGFKNGIVIIRLTAQ